jgi:hypothetical protein
MLKKISEKRGSVSKENMKSIKGGVPNSVICFFQCVSDCNTDEQIYYGTGAFWGANWETEMPI